MALAQILVPNVFDLFCDTLTPIQPIIGTINGVVINGASTQTAVASSANSIAVGNATTSSAAGAISVGGTIANSGANTTIVGYGGSGGVTYSLVSSFVAISNGLEMLRCNNAQSVGGLVYRTTTNTLSGTATTLTAAQVASGKLVCTFAGTSTLTLPSGTALDTFFANPYIGMTFVCYSGNTSATTQALITGAGVTLYAKASFVAGETVKLIFSRTGTNTWDCFA